MPIVIVAPTVMFVAGVNVITGQTGELTPLLPMVMEETPMEPTMAGKLIEVVAVTSPDD